MSQDYTPTLKKFFQSIRDWPWRSKFPSILFIRDYQELPDRSPNDVDLMIEVHEQKPFVDFVSDVAQNLDLYIHSVLTDRYCFVFLFDLDVTAQGRAWTYLEVRDKIQLTPQRSISSADIQSELFGECELPIPIRGWQAFLEIFQATRTGKFAKARSTLEQAQIDPNEAATRFKQLLNIEVQFSNPVSQDDVAIAEISDVIVRRPKKPITNLSARSQLNRLLSRNFYVYHATQPMFFSIHGPDGVGKSTTCREVEEIFSRLPLSFTSFHHITGWKHEVRAQQRAAREEAERLNLSEPQVGILHRMLRWVYRRLPISLQQTYAMAQGYNLYLSKLNARIYQEYTAGRIMLVDRYILDMVIKNKIAGNGPPLVHSLFVRLARRPVRAFILHDEALAIHQRKQELTIDEIEQYQSQLTVAATRYGIDHTLIDVAGRTPPVIAQAIVKQILDDCSPNMRSIFKTPSQ